MPRAAGEACVIPIILRPCYWKDEPFAKLQALPKNAKPITTWSDRDEAFLDVELGIRSAIERLTAPKIANDRVIAENAAQEIENTGQIAETAAQIAEITGPKIENTGAIPDLAAPKTANDGAIAANDGVIAENTASETANRADPIVETAKLPTFSFDIITVNDRGEKIDRQSKQAEYFAEDLGNGVTLEMVKIPAGEFLMGSPENEEGRRDSESPQHLVRVPSFFMGKFAVTQAQWAVVAKLPKVKIDLNPDPSSFKGAKRPVERVTWLEAVEFCDRLSKKTGRLYRLPSEAEWEYACRAGTTTPFHFGATITTDLVNCDGRFPYACESEGKYLKRTTDVGSLPPNTFGLCDMHGNVWEWCLDHWHDRYEGAPINGSAWIDPNASENAERLLRGGSWDYNPWPCRSASRFRSVADFRLSNIGFRVVSPARILP